MYTSLNDFADTRRKAVASNLESPELAALMIEKFAEGMHAAGADVIKEADALCATIDPNYKANRRLRYASVATLAFSPRPSQLSQSGT